MGMRKILFLNISAAMIISGRINAFSIPSSSPRCHHLPTALRLKTNAGSSKFPRTTRFMSSPNNNKSESNATQRPAPSQLLCSASPTKQKLGIAAIVTTLAFGTILSVQILNNLEIILPTTIYEPFYTVLPVVLGSVLASAGVAHFAIEDTFTSFVPPRGTWGGLWNVPAPFADELGLTYEQYHSYWTGIAEIGGGILLVLSRFGIVLEDIHIPAALLGLLVLAVTPANTYMFTHDPDVPRIPPLPYPWGHVGRGSLQCMLLGVFWKWATIGDVLN